jgi:hypothetical protein
MRKPRPSNGTRSPRWRRKPELLLLAACAGVTAGHVGVRRVFGADGPNPITVSTLSKGTTLIGLTLMQSGAAQSCRILISYNPDCPFCKRAAERERENPRAEPFARTTWVTGVERPSLARFDALLPPTATAVLDPELFRELRVRAVPGLYLIDPANVVRWVGPYRGDERAELLAERCAGTPAARAQANGP